MTISSGRERPDGVLDRDERVAVADLPAGVDADRREPLERVVEPLLGRGARRILVGGPRLEPRVERGAHDEEARPLGERERADRAQELLARDRLVRDHEDASLVGISDLLDPDALGSRRALAEVHPHRRDGQRDERQEAERRRDPRRHHDERERADRDQQELERRILAAKRAFHRLR